MSAFRQSEQLISDALTDDVAKCLLDWIESRDVIPRTRLAGANFLAQCVQVLGPHLTATSSPAALQFAVEQLRVHIFQKFSYGTAVSHYGLLRNGLLHLSGKQLIPTIVVPPIHLDDADLDGLSILPTGDPFLPLNGQKANLQWDLLARCCPTLDISKRLNEHIASKNITKHHLPRITEAARRLFEASPSWHTAPALIFQTLKSYRDGLLDTRSRHTAYMHYSAVSNAFKVLIEHQLLPSSTIIPKNFRRPKSALFNRRENPTLGTLNLYDPDACSALRSIESFIQDYRNELAWHLDTILDVARSIVHEGYKFFTSGTDLAAKSPLISLTAPEWSSAEALRGLLLPSNPESLSNVVAFFKAKHGSCYSYEILPRGGKYIRLSMIEGYLGLTGVVIAAMHAIIINECGINPYSLYSLKVSDIDRLGELVQADDDGNVRMNAVKWRQRKVQRRVAAGTPVALSQLTPTDITASVCLRMALEMSEAIRRHTGVDSLWVCNRGVGGPGLVSATTFQNNFGDMLYDAAPYRVLSSRPTLMKLRISRAMIFYIDSKGDVLQVAQYLGNSVRTAMDQYIPAFLQQAIYRKKMAAFQEVLLVMAAEDSPHDSHRLIGVDEVAYRRIVKSVFLNPDLSGRLSKTLTRFDDPSTPAAYFFALSERNLAIALKYIADGSDNDLVELCRVAVQKAAAGPIHVKQMLRRARTVTEREPRPS